MRYFILLAAISACALGASDYYGGFLNLLAPVNGLSQGSFELQVNHRFFGEAFKNDPLENFFGLDNGANVGFEARYFATGDLYFSYGHTRLLHGNRFSAGWVEPELGPVSLEVRAGYEAVKPSSQEDWDGGLTAEAGVSAMLLQDRLRPVVNFAYDGYLEEGGPGFGLEFYLMENMSLMGEYFPAAAEGAIEDCFSMGARYSTWGHQFIVALTNSHGIGPRGQLAGAADADLSMAFTIRRVL